MQYTVPSRDTLQEAVLHSVLISSGSQRVSIWSGLEAWLQIASLQSDLQTLARLQQNPPHPTPPHPIPCPPSSPSPGVLSWGSGYHMCSTSVFTSSCCCTVGGPRWCCTLRLRVCDSTSLIVFRCFMLFIVKTFYKGEIPKPQLCVFFMFLHSSHPFSIVQIFH